MLLAVFLVITALFVVLGIIFATGKGANLIRQIGIYREDHKRRVII